MYALVLHMPEVLAWDLQEIVWERNFESMNDLILSKMREGANWCTMVGNPPKGKLALEHRIFEEYLKAREKRS